MTKTEHKNKIRFTLIFESLENVHLHKDVGQIPYQLQKHFGFETEIACRKNEKCYDYLDGELKGLKLRFIETSTLYFLFNNAKNIDVLMLFHIKTESIYSAILYKLLNPQGILYLKYDLPDHKILYAEWGNRNFLTQLKRNFLFKAFVPRLDLFSVECNQVYNQLTKIPAANKILLPNGFDPDIPAYYGIVPNTFENKENLILLVGRHGSRQKNSELLLEALEIMEDIGNWNVVFVGPLTKEFEILKNAFLEKHPNFRDKIFFPGNISDKRLLFDYYNRSKIFCLPSLWESWGLVCGEALFFNNVLLMSKEILSSLDLTNNGQAGFLVEGENAGAWSEQLTMLMQNQEILLDYSQRAGLHFHNKFDWKNVLEELAFRIRKRRK